MTGPMPLFIIAAGLLLAAAAAAPSGLDGLPSQVAGVLGSGDQLSLQLRATPDAPARIIHLGGDAIDGWVLTGLTNTVATLSKDGLIRVIGLNPTGALALARPVVPPTVVRVTLDGLTPEIAGILALRDEEVTARMTPAWRKAWNATSPARGLTAEEGRRLSLYQSRYSLMYDALVAAAVANMRSGQRPGESVGTITRTDQESALLFGQDYIDLVGKQRQFDFQQAQEQYQAALANGVTMVWSAGHQDFAGYPGGMVMAGSDGEGRLYVAQPPVQPAPIDQSFGSPLIPTLTAETVRALTTPGGAPAGPAAQTAALAANERMLADIAALHAVDAATTFYGPFGVVTAP
ncbi:MAG: hypothetical protein JWM33_1604 [Caulobacteraceae bacterium]|nr:hypothetical protein [Caulobacteraceae bacterium]